MTDSLLGIQALVHGLVCGWCEKFSVSYNMLICCSSLTAFASRWYSPKRWSLCLSLVFSACVENHRHHAETRFSSHDNILGKYFSFVGGWWRWLEIKHNTARWCRCSIFGIVPVVKHGSFLWCSPKALIEFHFRSLSHRTHVNRNGNGLTAASHKIDHRHIWGIYLSTCGRLLLSNVRAFMGKRIKCV